MMKSVCASIVLLLSLSTARSAIGVWQNYTSMKDVRMIARSGEVFWAATSGGMFSWDSRSSGFTTLTSADGLKSIDLMAVAVDSRGNIWTGSSSGAIHVYSPGTGQLRYISDIANSQRANKGINGISVYGDTVLLCTTFGLSTGLNRADDKPFEFRDTFTKFGSLPQSTRFSVSSAVLFDGNLWIALSDEASVHRVAFASLDNPNLLEPGAWTVQTVTSQGSRVRVLAVFSGKLYAGTSAGAFRLNGNSWEVIAALDGRDIAGMQSSTGSLAVCTSDGFVYTVDAADNVTPYGTQLPAAASGVAIDEQGNPACGTRGSGIATFSTVWEARAPNGPNSSQFSCVAVDAGGIVWGASGSNSSAGFYRFNGNDWLSYTAQSANLPLNSWYRVSPGSDGSMWVCSYGRGMLEILAGATTIDTSKVYGLNVNLPGVVGDPAYIVPSTVATDTKGNTWTSIIYPYNGKVLSVRTSDGAWKSYSVRLAGSPPLEKIMDNPVQQCLAVDAFDNLWAASRDPVYRGVLGFNNRGAIDSVADFLISANNGLPSSDVNTIVIDNSGDLWVGTDRGIAIILDTSNPLRSGGIASYKPLTGTVINSIAVDALNQKWVGTNEGVVLLSPDGTQTLAQYTVESTDGKIIDNDVKSIALDGTTGTVYFATQNGLSSLTTAAAVPRTEFDKLNISPNPFMVPGNTQVTIDGLVENSGIKILSIDGRLVREIASPGGRIGFWDGRNEQGEFVSSGIYLITAFSETGDKVATGKIAVIRR